MLYCQRWTIWEARQQRHQRRSLEIELRHDGVNAGGRSDNVVANQEVDGAVLSQVECTFAAELTGNDEIEREFISVHLAIANFDGAWGVDAVPVGVAPSALNM